MIGGRSSFIAGLLVLFVAVRVSAAGEIFQVKDLPSLVWWGSAKDSPLFQNAAGTRPAGPGDPVGFLGDLSGNNNNAVMGAAVVSGGDDFRPRLEANVVRGQPGIFFDGVDDFLDLNRGLFDGSSSFTIAFAIAGANANLGNRRLFGATGATERVAVEVSGAQQLTVGARGGSAGAELHDAKGHSIAASYGPENTQIIIARYQAGGTFDLFNNGQLVASTTVPSDRLTARADDLIGNENLAAGHGNPSPVPDSFAQFHLLEGVASRSALSDAQVSNLYNYWTQKFPGVQHQAFSPNLYWDTSANPSRTLPASHDVGHIQGIAAGDGARYVFYTGMIDKYDPSWNGLTHNDSILTGISNPAGPALHGGDGDYFNGRVYAPLENDFGGTGQYIAVYDANRPNLPLISFKDITAQHHEVSSLTIAPEQGQHGVMFLTSFFDNLGADRLWMYDFAGGDPANPHFGDFLGSLTLPSELKGLQGVTWRAPYFYFADVGSSSIVRVKFTDGLLSPTAETMLVESYNTMQGLGFDGSTLLQAEQSGLTTEYAEPLINVDFQARDVPEPNSISLILFGLCLLAVLATLRRKKRSHSVARPVECRRLAPYGKL